MELVDFSFTSLYSNRYTIHERKLVIKKVLYFNTKFIKCHQIEAMLLASSIKLLCFSWKCYNSGSLLHFFLMLVFYV